MAAAPAAKVWTVSELNALIKDILDADKRLQLCYVAGEIFNFKHHTSGHMYFTLKDEKSRIRAVMFAGRARSLAFQPADGMKVIVMGTVSVFDRDGQYQLYVDDMQPDGVGALYVAFTQLRDKLEREGLFRPDRKRPLPKFPRRIGVVTSPTGAVIRDICTTLERRYPLAKVLLAPALVQGPTAAPSIVEAIGRLVDWSATRETIDVIIVGRGGGSLEELWPFNEELVARAIASCPIPVVSAVGHETDTTICDFVADVRAATPTAAAELVAPHIQDVRAQIAQWEGRSGAAVRFRLGEQRRRLASLEQAPVIRDPAHIVNRLRQQVDYLDAQVNQWIMRPLRVGQRQIGALAERLYRVDISGRIAAARRSVEQAEHLLGTRIRERWTACARRLDGAIAALEALNPLSVLRRGYSVVSHLDGRVVSSVRHVKPGDIVAVRVVDGSFQARVQVQGEPEHERSIQSRLDI